MRILVTPRPGFTVRDPKTMAPLPAEGAIKEDASCWRRLESAGDVTIRPEIVEAAADAMPKVKK